MTTSLSMSQRSKEKTQKQKQLTTPIKCIEVFQKFGQDQEADESLCEFAMTRIEEYHRKITSKWVKNAFETIIYSNIFIGGKFRSRKPREPVLKPKLHSKK